MTGKAIDILYLAKQNGIDILLAEDQLQLKLPKGKEVDEALLKEIKDNKELLVNFLKENRKKNSADLKSKIAKTERDNNKKIPLSFSQERLWFIDKLEGSRQYHIPAVFKLKGVLNTDALEKAFREVINRHEILRTVILEENGEPYQKIKDIDEWKLSFLDSTQNKADENCIQKYIQDQINSPFDLSGDYMLRAALIKKCDQENILSVTLHHIASDGWSMSVLIKEVTELYAAYEIQREPDLLPLELQYKDYAVWQRENSDNERFAKNLEYWKKKLIGAEPLNIFTDFPRPSIQTNNGAVSEFKIDREKTASLKALSLENEATLFMTLLSALNVLLFRYSGQQNICIGTGTAGRPVKELEGLIGFFINTLALKSDLRSDMAFTDLLKQVKQTTLEAYDNQDIPFGKIVEEVVDKRDMSRHPIFQVMFTLQNTPEAAAINLGELLFQREATDHITSLFDLSYNIAETDNGLSCSLEYNTDLFSEQTINRMLNHYQILLGSIVEDPVQEIGKLKLISAEEENYLLKDFNNTKSEYPKDKSIIELFEEQVSIAPNDTALVFEDSSLTYDELNKRANQLGHYLKSKGVKEETPVAICIERSAELMIGILGILKAGGAYVPVNPNFPNDLIQFTIDDTESKIILSGEQVKSKLPEVYQYEVISLDEDRSAFKDLPESNLQTEVKPDDMAYVIYTSGSTGKPKGVVVTQKNVVSLVKGVDYVSLNKNNILLSTGSSSFDATTFEYWGMLLNGGQLVFCEENKLLESDLLKEEIGKRKVNMMWFTASWFNQLVESDISVFTGLKTILVGGEKLSEYHIEKVLQKYPHIEIINGYGPTENTTFSLTCNIKDISSNRTIPIGSPLNNRKAYILDEREQVVPVGVAGEIFLSGDGLSRGYLKRPDLTVEKFVKDPFSEDESERMYKTGDTGRWHSDGTIEYLGRKDDQVKIRGFRIETGEIESVMLESKLVTQAAVIVKEDAEGNKDLAAYVIPAESYDRSAIQHYLKKKLPEFMIPSLWMEVENFSLTSNGKIDKRALPEIEGTEQLGNVYAAPRNKLEEKLAFIWQNILKTDKAGIEDNFFESGGHSLLAMRLISAIRNELNVELTVKDLFINPSIKELSEFLQRDSNTNLLPVIEHADVRPELIPLSFSQERLWFIDQLEGSIEYNLPSVLRLKGNLNIDALEYSLRQIITRHEILRTVIKEKDGHGYQFIMDANRWKLNIIDGSEFDKKNDNEQLRNYLRQLNSKAFDLSNDYMLRADLICLSESDHVLSVTMHHIASDAWSVSLIVNEVMEFYNACTESRPEQLLQLRIQYADYAIWQRNFLKGKVLEERLDYWKNKLVNAEPIKLPIDFERPAYRSTKGSYFRFNISKEIQKELHELSRKEGSSLFMIMLTIFKILLYRYTGQSNLTVGTSITNRTQQEVEYLIGFFVNTLALHTEVDGSDSFYELLSKVKATTLDAYAHQEVPFEKIVDAVVKERDPNRSPLFQVMLVHNNTPEVPALKIGDVELSGEVFEVNISKFEITVFIDEDQDGIRGTIQYRTDLFSESTIKSMASHFQELLKSALKDPQQKIGHLQMLTADEEQKLLTDVNTSTVIYPKDKSVVDLFEEQVRKTPDAAALVFENEQLTYHELNERSNRLAHYLKSKGVKEETLVPLYVERGLDMMVGILGILKSGAAYVPIDTDFPKDRISYMLEDTKSVFVVSSKESKLKLSDLENIEVIDINDTINESKEDLEIKISPEQLAYVIYTSGSTGKPKGVMIEHRNLVDYVFGLNEKTKIEDSKSFALVSTIATDLGNTVIYSSLLSGGALHLFSKESVSNIEYLHKYFEENIIDCIKIVPSHWKALIGVTDGKLLLPEKLLVFGGETLPSELVEKIWQSGSDCTVVNHYGPTETTIGKLLHVTSPENNYGNTIPIGKPFSNTKVYVLSKDMELCPVGVPGELYIAGDGIARGYFNNEELTKEKFSEVRKVDKVSKVHKVHKVDDIVEIDSGSIMYGTGDLVKYTPDGNILFLGRVDDQVKIRGYRIELGEIENALRQNDLVKEAVVLAREDKQGNKRLVGYITADKDSDKGFSKEGITEWLKEKLPEYMMPSVLIEMESFPLTANGKLDKKALPDPDLSELLSGQYEESANEAEAKLIEIWQEVLEVDQVGVNDDFFELGGHSLLAVRLVSLIRKEFETEMPIGDVFDYPTVRQLATRLEVQTDNEILPGIETSSQRPDKIPLSFSQERLWFLDKLEGSVQYHVPSVLRLKGKLNKEALAKSIKEIISRHEILRTVILEEGGIGYQFINEADNWELQFTEGIKYSKDDESLKAYIKELINKPFDLSKDYMVRADLISLSEDDNILVVTLHHIASDGWSTSVMVRELVELYRSYAEGSEAKLQQLTMQYADYAIWQRNYLQGDVLESKLDYWKENLEGVEPLQLPTDFKRSALQSIRGSVTGFSIEKEVSEKLNDLSKRNGTSLFMTLFAAFNVLLYRYSGQEDICIGTPIAGRNHHSLEGMIGFFINSLPLRNQLRDDLTYTSFLQEVRKTTLKAYENQEVPFEKVVEAVVKDRDQSRNPLFQVLFTLQNTPEIPEIKLGNVTLSVEGSELTTVKFDLSVNMFETESGIQGTIQYCTDLYTEDTIKSMVNHFKELLNSITDAPDCEIGKLAILGNEELNLILNDLSVSPGEYPADKSIIDLFEEQAAKNPENTALTFGEENMSYGELNQRSNKFANYLQTKGVKTETLVPICIERGFDMIVGILGILKSGGAYVPIDPDYPEDRIKFILNDTSASVVVSSEESSSKFKNLENKEVINIDNDWSIIEELSPDNLISNINPKQLAYVIYTSGSTGKPKGVLIEHFNVVRLFKTDPELFDFSKKDVWTMFHSFCFDFSVWEMFGALLFGGRLVLVPKVATIDANQYSELLIREKVTVLNQTPTAFYILQDVMTKDKKPLKIRNVIFGGEALNPSKLLAWKETYSDCRLINMYGITETTVHVTFQEIGMKEIQSGISIIGKPIPTLSSFILDKNFAILPIGVFGEIYVSGAGLARGYLNSADLTNQKFISNPFSKSENSRLYKTGDLGRWNRDGNMEYAGRLDEQVKIRGFRIELGEIENWILQSELVSQGIVLSRRDRAGNNSLIGYVKKEEQFDKQALINYLKSKLPDYMVPVIWYEIENFPLTKNGKIDKNALPNPDASELLKEVYVAPGNELERALAGIWQELLDVERVGVHDNYFELGGHSLMALRLFDHIEKLTRRKLALSTLFNSPTIKELAALIKDEGWTVPWKSLIPIKPGGSRLPFFCVPPAAGTALHFQHMLKYIHPDQPVFVLEPLGLDGKEKPHYSITEMASFYVKEILSFQPKGPYLLGGRCFGGRVVFEMAQQLMKRGHTVSLLAVFDTWPPFIQTPPEYIHEKRTIRHFLDRSVHHIKTGRMLNTARNYTFNQYSKVSRKFKGKLDYLLSNSRSRLFEEIKNIHFKAQDNYVATKYPGKITLIESESYKIQNREGWRNLAEGGFEYHNIPETDHRQIMLEPQIKLFTEKLNFILEQTFKEIDHRKSSNGTAIKSDKKEKANLN